MKIIIDLDGCIADDRHRRHLIDHSKGTAAWDAYHTACGMDRYMNTGCVDLARRLGCDVLILTSRPIRHQSATLQWLDMHTNLDTFTLLMRPENNHQPSPELKKNLLTRAAAGSADALCAFDDREDVLQMYRELGIPTVRVGYEPVDVGFATSPCVGVPDLLRAGAKTFEERNAVYGETYETFGRVMAGMLPDGLHIDAGDVAKFNRLGVFVQIVTKMCRYATSIKGDGHIDSAHDAMVYSAMLEYLTRNK